MIFLSFSQDMRAADQEGFLPFISFDLGSFLERLNFRSMISLYGTTLSSTESSSILSSSCTGYSISLCKVSRLLPVNFEAPDVPLPSRLLVFPAELAPLLLGPPKPAVRRLSFGALMPKLIPD